MHKRPKYKRLFKTNFCVKLRFQRKTFKLPFVGFRFKFLPIRHSLNRILRSRAYVGISDSVNFSNSLIRARRFFEFC